MKFGKALGVFMASVCVTALAACGNVNNTAGDAENTTIKSLAGMYTSGRCTVEVTAVDEDSAQFQVTWGGGANETSTWTMSGDVQQEDGRLYVYYQDAERVDHIFDENDEETVKTVYVGGNGSFTFSNDGTLTWDDNAEHAADDMVFSLGA